MLPFSDLPSYIKISYNIVEKKCPRGGKYMKVSIRKIGILLAIAILLIVIPTVVKAATEKAAIVNIEGDYAVYVKGKEQANFKFAFTNEEELTAEEAQEKLTFINYWEDTNGIHTACLEKDSNIDINKAVTLWIEEGSETYAIEIDVSKAVKKEQIVEIEKLGNHIRIDSDKAEVTSTVKKGITKTVSRGQVYITDDQKSEYQYQLVKLDGTESEEVKKLMGALEKVQMQEATITMYEKVQLVAEVQEAYRTVLEKASWKKAEELIITEPKETKDGDKYLLVLQKKTGEEITNDIQILDCTYTQRNEVEKEKQPVNVITALPKTYDSVILVVILSFLATAVAAVVVRIRILKAQAKAKAKEAKQEELQQEKEEK